MAVSIPEDAKEPGAGDACSCTLQCPVPPTLHTAGKTLNSLRGPRADSYHCSSQGAGADPVSSQRARNSQLSTQ